MLPAAPLSPQESYDLAARFRRLAGIKTRVFDLPRARALVETQDRLGFEQDKNNWLRAIQAHPEKLGAEIAIALFDFFLGHAEIQRRALGALWQRFLQSAGLAARTRALLARQLGILEAGQGDFAAALRHLSFSIETMERLGERQLLGNDYYEIGLVYRNSGDYQAAWEAFLKAETLARQADNPKTVLFAQGQRANLLAVQSHFPAAVDLLEATLQAWQALPDAVDRSLQHTSLHTLGRIYLDNGRFSQAAAALQASLRLKEARGERYDAIVRTRAALAEAWLHLGAGPAAAACLTEAMVEACLSMGSYLYGASALKTLSRMALAAGQPAAARRFSARAIEAAGLSNNPLTRFEVQLWAAALAWQLGRPLAVLRHWLGLVQIIFQLRLPPAALLRLIVLRVRTHSTRRAPRRQ